MKRRELELEGDQDFMMVFFNAGRTDLEDLYSLFLSLSLCVW